MHRLEVVIVMLQKDLCYRHKGFQKLDQRMQCFFNFQIPANPQRRLSKEFIFIHVIILLGFAKLLPNMVIRNNFIVCGKLILPDMVKKLWRIL
jgi:hypothetical protein